MPFFPVRRCVLSLTGAALALAPLVAAHAQNGAPASPPGPTAAQKPAAQKPAAAKPSPAAAGGQMDATVAALSQRFGPKLSVPVTLSDGVRTVTRTRRELGVRLDLERMKAAAAASKNGRAPLILVADKTAMKDALSRIAPRFARPARDAKPFVYRGAVRIDKGAYGRSLNVSTTAEIVAATLAKKPAARQFRAAINKKPPVLTAERLKGINGVLGSYATSASPNPKRNHNIALSVGRINGTLLSPGETFSLNQTVGERTQARGFLTAPVFEDGEKVPGIGGGVSQVTGTLFNAAALAGLKIAEVNPHSRPVAYIPIGRDATVAFGAKDLKFTNNTNAPVYVAYAFRRPRLAATVFGRKTPGRRVSLRPVVQRRGPGDIRAQLFRVVRQNGKVTKERLFTHQYKWEPDKKG